MMKSRFGRGGFTFIELLIAAAMGVIVLVAAVQMFRSNRIAYELVRQMTQMEENGRVGVDMMAKELRMAGAGSPGLPVNVWDNASTAAVNGSTYSELQASLTVKPGTDIVEIFYSVIPEPISIPSFNANAANVQVPSNKLVGLPGYTTNLGQSEVDALLDPYTVLIYECAASSNQCTQNITGGRYVSGGAENLIEYNRGTCDDSTVYGYAPPLAPDTMYASLFSTGEAWAAAGGGGGGGAPGGGGGAPGGGGGAPGGGGGAPGGSDCANRPHDCTSVHNKDVCITIGYDTYFYVDNSDTANPRLVRYTLGGRKEVISNYVEDLQFSVGEDSSGDGVIQSGEWGDGVTNAADIRMVKLNIMVKATREDIGKAQEVAPTLENSTITKAAGGDRYRRRVMTRTVRLRNLGND